VILSIGEFVEFPFSHFLQENVEVENLVGLQEIAHTRPIVKRVIVVDAVLFDPDHHANAANAITVHIRHASGQQILAQFPPMKLARSEDDKRVDQRCNSPKFPIIV
jgi:hypothetical protein